MKNRIGHDMMAALDDIACLATSGRRALDDEKPGLLMAARCLDHVANGEPTERMECLTGAATMAAHLMTHRDHDRDLLDAGEALHRLATGRSLDLDDIGRRRAAHLADCLRLLTEGKRA